MAMKGFFEGLLQTVPIAEIAPGYGLEVLGPHVRRQEVDKRCLDFFVNAHAFCFCCF
jgi:hypothetical protein